MEFERIRDEVEEHFSCIDNSEITTEAVSEYLKNAGLPESQIETWMIWAHIHYMSRGY